MNHSCQIGFTVWFRNLANDILAVSFFDTNFSSNQFYDTVDSNVNGFLAPFFFFAVDRRRDC